GASILNSTLLGGLGSTLGFRIVLDNQTNAYVTGSEDGPGFPVTPGKINPGGVFKSVNGAARWTPSNLGLLHNEVGGIGIDPVNKANLYAGTGRGIARSTNAGASWQVSLDTFDQIVTFGVDPADPSIIYAGGSQVLKSTNSGASWFQSSTGLVTSANAPTHPFSATTQLA